MESSKRSFLYCNTLSTYEGTCTYISLDDHGPSKVNSSISGVPQISSSSADKKYRVQLMVGTAIILYAIPNSPFELCMQLTALFHTVRNYLQEGQRLSQIFKRFRSMNLHKCAR
jgi:hypothetical protein